MRKWIFVVSFLALASCDTHHPDIYIYRDQTYTTNQVSDFEVSHFKKFGNDNLLILEDAESKNDVDRSEALDKICSKHTMDCKRLDISGEDQQTSDRILKSYNYYSDQKFFVLSPRSEATVKFVGVVNVLKHKGDEQSLSAIFKANGVEEKKLNTYLMGLKKKTR